MINRRKYYEHLAAILFVGIVFIGFIVVISPASNENKKPVKLAVEKYSGIDFIDFSNPTHISLFRETLSYYKSPGFADSVISGIIKKRESEFIDPAKKAGAREPGLKWNKLSDLFIMYLQFMMIFVITMGLSYYTAISVGTIRFVNHKSGKDPYLKELIKSITPYLGKREIPKNRKFYTRTGKLVLLTIGKAIAYLTLFSPAYVIAYSFKTRFDTDSILFMILLGVLSNGILITYSNKFFTFLLNESRKGYVETAVVKNLNSSYKILKKGVMSWKSLLRIKKKFPDHVFQHIYINAHYQYISTIKEQASFLITGLIIIEMALNIQGHLFYEMLQNILYKDYAVVAVIVFGIFFIIKFIDVIVDLWLDHENRKYENIN
ncbi:MAG: hypothetical protein K9G63_18035 [Melioribacteraceae bacterium]|nr:hypothetical protein [Melioribacteraceae bacterium]